jgi:hypothetical protein
MPDNGSPELYRERAEHWRVLAAKIPPGATRDAYITLADGYAKLADQIERNKSDRSIGPDRPSQEE